MLLARAFSSGCAALTGVEAISNGVPAFRKPKSRNAATTLLLLGTIAITMLLSIIALARNMGMRYVDPNDIDRLRTEDGQQLAADYDQHTVIAQLSKAIFSDFPPGFYFVVAMTGIILVLAANTAFNGFPVLGSILARDGFAPRALGSRGDRLAYSNGIVFLAVMAIILILAFNAETSRLIQLYIVGVFVSFNLSQLGMIRHWTRHLKTEKNPAVRRRMYRSRAINTFGLGMTAVVFVIVLVTKFFAGAWIAIVAMVIFYVIMKAIRRHYDNVQAELAADEDDKIMPTRVHAIVLVSKLHKPTLRALAFAKATRPNVLEAVYVSTSPEDTSRLLEEWDQRRIDVPLKVLHSPYRELIRPIVEYATEIKMANPRGVVAVYIPEYVVGRWWEQLLHNQTALRLKGRLLFTPGVMVTSVPYQLRSSEIARERELREEFRVRPGDLRRGEVDRRGDAAATAGTGTAEPRAPTPHPPTAGEVPRRGAVRRGGGAGRPRRPLRGAAARHRRPGPGGLRQARAARRAGRRRDHRGDRRRQVLARRRRRGARAVAGPGRPALPVRRPRPLRGLRLPARDAGAAAVAQGGRGPRAALPAGRPRARGHRGAGARQTPDEEDGLRWRTRQRYVALPGDRRGMRKHRSHEVVEVDDCLIARSPGRPRRARHRVRGGGRRLLAGAPRRPGGARRHRPGLPGRTAGGVGARPVRRRRVVRAVPGRRGRRSVRRDAGRGRPARLRAR